MTDSTENWYVVKRPAGHCDIVSNLDVEKTHPDITEQWGPFNSQGDAIARRIGLIRSGKCQPQ
ncbi:DDE transposase family protein [Tolypothrix sp. PCC 7910]|uniref:DDE transposase family protein n=1 Tax=Tolypothrix sp. PCC 7910 TaxID=2099387 RepID=UPI001427A04D|nr:DDE transposase family protein [Tolypothrix sp. PCC 7910]QIR39624.1 DDE transposase family protein [Tolypothrix sp. PCC 7910]